MGISLSAVMVTDDQIRDFIDAPDRLKNLLNGILPFLTKDKCYLADYWRELHPILTHGTDGDTLPACALDRGDVSYSAGLSNPAHAIYHATTRAFVDHLNTITESALKEQAGRQGLSFPPLLVYFERLRDFAAQAVAQGKGLVFCHYEDW